MTTRGDAWVSPGFMLQPWNRNDNGDTSIIVDTQVDEIQIIHDSMLYDTCIPQARVEGGTDYGYGKPAYTNGSALACVVIDITPKRESEGAQARMTDVKIRFNRSAVLNNFQRIKVTKMHGVAVSGLWAYEIIEGPQLDHTGVMIIGKLVTDGSET